MQTATDKHFSVLPSYNRSVRVVASNPLVWLAGKTAGNTSELIHPTDESLVDLQSWLTLHIKMMNLAELTECWSASVGLIEALTGAGRSLVDKGNFAA